MGRRTILTVAAGAAALGLVAAVAARASTPPRTKPRPSCPALTAAEVRIAGLRARVFVTGGAAATDTLPMVIALHGRGATPELMETVARGLPGRVRVIVPAGLVPLGLRGNRMWFEGRAKDADQSALAANMAAAADAFAPFMREALRCYPTRGAPVLLGHSQGGMMALAVGARYPALAGRVAAGSSWLPPDLWTPNLPPSVLVHGTGDDIVPYARTAQMVFDLAELGAPVQLQAVAGGHGLSGELLARWLEGARP